jgi:hypothetical protein
MELTWDAVKDLTNEEIEEILVKGVKEGMWKDMAEGWDAVAELELTARWEEGSGVWGEWSDHHHW